MSLYTVDQVTADPHLLEPPPGRATQIVDQFISDTGERPSQPTWVAQGAQGGHATLGQARMLALAQLAAAEVALGAASDAKTAADRDLAEATKTAERAAKAVRDAQDELQRVQTALAYRCGIRRPASAVSL